MTNHIIQISIDMDTDRVQKIIEEQAARQIITDIQGKIEEELFNHTGWKSDAKNPDRRSGFSGYILEKFSDFIEKNKDAIIQYAGDKLVEKTIRSKAYKEILEGLKK